MSNIDKQAGEGDVSPKTYYIHPMAFGGTQNPGHGHVPVVHADDFEKLQAKLEAAEKRIADYQELISSLVGVSSSILREVDRINNAAAAGKGATS